MNLQHKIEPFSNQPDCMINLCQAAQVLGYKDYRKIESFIDSGLLESHFVEGAKRKKVKYHDVMRLAQPISPIKTPL